MGYYPCYLLLSGALQYANVKGQVHLCTWITHLFLSDFFFVLIARDVRLFTLLEQIREEQQNQTTILGTILAKLGEGCEDPMPEDISFPITTEQEMANFEEKMKDKYMQKVVVSCFNC